MDNLRISIVRASTIHADIVANLLFHLLNELDNGKGPSFTEVQTTTKRLIDGELVVGMIAFIENQPIGVLMLNECAAVYASGRFGEITEVYVTPEYRSQGIGPKLIAEAQSIAKERDWKRLEVGAPPQPAWNKTLEFYLREGFEEVGPRLRLLV